MVGLMFAVVVILSFAIETQQENNSIELGNVVSAEIQKNATDEVANPQESQVIYLIRTIMNQSERNEQSDDENHEANVHSKTGKAHDLKIDSNENRSTVKIERTDTNESIESDKEESTPENSRNNTRQKFIMDSLSKMFNRNHNRNINSKNVDLNLTDNEHSISNHDNQDDKNIKEFNNYSKFGAIIDMKGRSGLLADGSPVERSRPRFLPIRRGFIINPGFLKFPSPPAVTFSKIDNRDILTIGNLNNLHYRRLEIPETALRSLESLEADGNDPPTADERNIEELPVDSNAYRYEPEEYAQPIISGTTMSYRRHYV